MADLFASAEPTLEEQIAEVQRELAQRERVYPRLIADRKLTEQRAQQHTARMQAVLRTLEKLRGQAPRQKA